MTYWPGTFSCCGSTGMVLKAWLKPAGHGSSDITEASSSKMVKGLPPHTWRSPSCFWDRLGSAISWQWIAHGLLMLVVSQLQGALLGAHHIVDTTSGRNNQNEFNKDDGRHFTKLARNMRKREMNMKGARKKTDPDQWPFVSRTKVVWNRDLSIQELARHAQSGICTWSAHLSNMRRCLGIAQG